MKYDDYYQTYMDKLRRDAAQNVVGGWPGKPVGSPAVSRYPNILTEHLFGDWSFHDMADVMRVSPAILAAILEDGEDVSSAEAARLLRYSPYVKYGYLFAPTLQMISYRTDKRKRQYRELLALWNEARRSRWYSPDDMRRAGDLLALMKMGSPVPFAAWRWSRLHCMRAIQADISEPVRESRLA